MRKNVAWNKNIKYNQTDIKAKLNKILPNGM